MLSRVVGVPARIVSLRVGWPQDPLQEVGLDRAVRAFRTHLDSFTLEECGVLAYCGYGWVERFLTEGLLKDYVGTMRTEPKSLAEILPPECGPWDPDVEHLCGHLRWSGSRMKWWRMLRRRLG
jgi:hypothetical protein